MEQTILTKPRIKRRRLQSKSLYSRGDTELTVLLWGSPFHYGGQPRADSFRCHATLAFSDEQTSWSLALVTWGQAAGGLPDRLIDS